MNRELELRVNAAREVSITSHFTFYTGKKGREKKQKRKSHNETRNSFLSNKQKPKKRGLNRERRSGSWEERNK